MFLVKQVKRSQVASWDVVCKILLTYGDADRREEQLGKLKVQGWRVIKNANHEPNSLEIMNTVTQLVPEKHDDSTGGQPDLTGLTREELLSAIEELSANATPETIMELGKALNNGVTLANKTPLKAKPKRGSEKVDVAQLTSRFMVENPPGSTMFSEFMTAMAQPAAMEAFLVKWATSKMAEESASVVLSEASTFEELLGK